jgi:hypothetical protein
LRYRHHNIRLILTAKLYSFTRLYGHTAKACLTDAARCPNLTADYASLANLFIRQAGICFYSPLLNQQDAKTPNGKTLIFFKRRKKSQPSCALIAAIAVRTAKRLQHNGAGVCFWCAT